MLVTLAASLIAVLLLAGTARLLKLGHEARLDAGEAAAAVEGALAGFDSARTLVAVDGTAALVLATDGRLAAVKLHGARAAVREVRWPAIRATAAGAVIDTNDRRFGSVTLPGVDALDLRRLAGS